ncbi:MAG TPA: beta-ketoacyl-[acyl-carrier-protein] synthase II [Desulfobacteraceae bacterium]|nr:beta-ketoacyl-[acyl-carrier-protein] synthase II [Desulfobacteraceae bacterium]
MKRRVVVTGLGMVTPLGTGVDKNRDAIYAGRSGIRKITKFDVSSFPCKIAGEIPDFNSEDWLDRKQIRRFDIFVHYAIASARMAIEDAGLKIRPEDAHRIGCITGSGLGGLSMLEHYHKVLLERGPERISPFFIPGMIANMAPGQIAIEFGLRGPNLSIETACAASCHAVGEAFRMIREGIADVMITGGSEMVVTPLALGGFCAMKALATSFNDEPERASRPFDLRREGFVMGEGAGILVLEELGHALRRDAPIYAEIVGYGTSADAYHVAAPDPDGEGAYLCIKNALMDSGLRPEEIDYINAHGTSTKLNDLSECKAIKRLFGEHAYRLSISSTKSMIGHLLGGAGGVEAIYTVLAIRDGIMPPTINYENPDPELDLDFVPNKARKAEIGAAISNSFGFGGTNATLVFKAFKEL